jgi:hypothetical protein
MNLPVLATDIKVQKIEAKFTELTKYATNALGDAKILDVYGIRYFAFPKNDFKIVRARLDLYWYYHLQPTYDLSYFLLLEEDYYSMKDHLQLHESITKKNIKKNRILFSGIGFGAGSILTIAAIVLIKSALN